MLVVEFLIMNEEAYRKCHCGDGTVATYIEYGASVEISIQTYWRNLMKSSVDSLNEARGQKMGAIKFNRLPGNFL